MYAMSMWALARTFWPLLGAAGSGQPATNLKDPVPWVAVVLSVLGGLMLIEAARIVLSGMLRPPPAPERAPPAALPA
jgi:hypothetical protein